MDRSIEYILKQWIALEAHSDWLPRLWISFAIHFRATGVGFASKNIVIMVGINKLKTSFLLYYLTVLVYTQTDIHPGVSG